MSPIPLGILAASGVFAAGSYDLLATEILTSSQASVTFSSLSSYAADYQHLQLRYTAKDNTTTAANDSYLSLRFNADSGNNYATHYLQGTGSAVQSGASTSINNSFLHLVTNSANDNNFAAGVIDILDAFNSNKNSTIRSFNGFAGNRIRLVSGLWMNTASITSIAITPQTADFKIGSRFSLYGLRKAA